MIYINHINFSDKYHYFNDEKKKKLNPKSVPYVFTSYNDESKAYTFYNPQNKKTIISQDVIFVES